MGRNAIDPLVRRVLLIAGGSMVLALVSFAVAVAVSGDPLGLRSQAVPGRRPARLASRHRRRPPDRAARPELPDLPAHRLAAGPYQDGETWHALELGVRSPRHHVAMAIYSGDRDWGAGWALFETFKASFVPPAA